MVFSGIAPAAGLADDERRMAIETGPGFVASRATIRRCSSNRTGSLALGGVETPIRHNDYEEDAANVLGK